MAMWLALILTLFGAFAAAGQESVLTIIQRSIQANSQDWTAGPTYSYFESDRQRDVTRTYEVLMILGSPYQRLVAVNGGPLAPEEQAKEQQKLGNVIAQRRGESKHARKKRIDKYENERKRDHMLMNEMSKAFNFKIVGEEKSGSFDVYVLQATPKPGYQPPNSETKVLTGMQGKLWIDKATFRWVKIEAEVLHPVSIAGFLARVEPGTRFELEKMPVAEGIWLPKHFAMKSRAKILFLFTSHKQVDEIYFDYRKAVFP